ncbi:MAG: argininosuccinate lyase, partial [Chloroflexota bacterium]
FPINRQMTAADLGFDAITTNSMDAVADRDYVCDALYACSMIAMHISRLSEEVCLWATGEYRFITLSDAFSTGSSIMPQKKNPDVAELARGKSGRVFGHLMAMLTVLKGTPLAYNKDFQEDKEALFDAVDTVLITLDVVPPMMRTATWNSTRMAEAAIADFSLATDAADLLARNGVPFREAHEVVGQLVGSCVRENRTFADLSDAEWAAIHPVFAKQRPPLQAIESVAARDVPGGTAPRQVADATAQAKGRVLEEAAELDEVQRARAARFTPPVR